MNTNNKNNPKIQTGITILKKEKFPIFENTEITIYYIYPKIEKILGVIFIPSLIGGSYMQQFNFFSSTMQAGYIFTSFHYRGHKGSGGKFSIRTALEDSFIIINYIKQKLPYDMYAIGTCFSSIPLIFCLKKDPLIFKKIVLVNSIFNLKQIGSIWDIAKIYYKNTILRNPFNFANLLSAVTQHLFPHIDQSKEHFGHLQYKNAAINDVAFEYATYNPVKLKNKLDCPALCCYGVDDYLLKLPIPKYREIYINKFTNYFNNIKFFKENANHFWDNKLDILNEKIKLFLGEIN